MGSPGASVGSPGASVGSPSVSVGSPGASGRSSGASIGSPSASVGSPNVSVGSPSVSIGSGGGTRGVGDLEGILRESMGDYDREIGRERGVMASSGQGSAAGPGSAGGMIGQPSGSGGPMVTIPNAGAGGGIGGGGQGAAGGSASAGSGSGAGGGGGGAPREGGASAGPPETKVEIPEDVADAVSSEDQVARQIREAAEQEEDERIREALWDEYRRHMGLKKK